MVESSRKGAVALQCDESGHCARGDIGVLGEGAVSDVCESYEKAALLCLLLSTRVSLSNIRSADPQILWLVSRAKLFKVYSPPAVKRQDGESN